MNNLYKFRNYVYLPQFSNLTNSNRLLSLLLSQSLLSYKQYTHPLYSSHIHHHNSPIVLAMPNSYDDCFNSIYLCVNTIIHANSHFTCREFDTIMNARSFYNVKYASHSDNWVNRYAILSIPRIYPHKIHANIIAGKLESLFDLKHVTLDINTD